MATCGHPLTEAKSLARPQELSSELGLGKKDAVLWRYHRIGRQLLSLKGNQRSPKASEGRYLASLTVIGTSMVWISPAAVSSGKFRMWMGSKSPISNT